MDKTMFKPLKPTSLKEEFVLHMEELILRGNMKAGEKLPPERELAKEFKVSRPVVHEGLLLLETRGLVTLRPRHGVIVNDYRKKGTLDLLLSLIKEKDHDLGPGLTRDLEHFRIHMEKDIVKLICRRERNNFDELDQLININNKMKSETGEEELAELDFQFHLLLGLACGNALYSLLYNTLKPAHMDLLVQFYQNKDNKMTVFNYHQLLIETLVSKDEEKAICLIEKTDSFNGYV